MYERGISMKLELIATNIADVKAASEYGADRIELCSGMKDDGLTPSYGLIESAVDVSTIPINVMIRPHSQSFYYDEAEIEMMVKDIQVVRKLGANGIVVGALTEDGQVDVNGMNRLLEAAEDLDVTFHRAIDFSRNLEETLETLAQFKQIQRVLTAGGKLPAPQSVGSIKRLMELAQRTHLNILPGVGLKVSNLQPFIEEVRPSEIHVGSGARVEESFMMPIDRGKVERMKELMKL